MNYMYYILKKYGYKLYVKLILLKSKFFPSKFNLNNYDKSLFIFKFNSTLERSKNKINRNIYAIWFGSKNMPVNREKAFQAMCNKFNSKSVKVVLITFDNLHDYVLKDYPLHKSFDYLSNVHKSDYIRCYMMHHYGGGYADIKYYDKSWCSVFDLIDNNADKDFVGYREVGRKGVASLPGILGQDLKNNFFMITGCGSFIHAPYTKFTHEWITEVENRLDELHDKLVYNPGNDYGSNQGYPVPWSFLLAQVYHPLNVKYNKRFIITDTIKPNFERLYR